MGIDRKRIVDNFYPAGSTVADYFTPCDDPVRLRRRQAGTTSTPAAAKQLLADAGFPDGFKTPSSHYRDVVRGYLPDPPVIATEIQAAAEGQPRASPSTLDVQESGDLPRQQPRPASSTASSCSAGAPTIPTRPTSSTTTSGRLGQEVRQAVPGHRRRRSTTGAQSAEPTRLASAAYTRPTTRSRRTSRWSRSPTAAPARPSRPTSRARYASPLRQRAVSRVDEGRRPRHDRVHAERRAAQPLLRRRDRRRDPARLRAGRPSRSTATRSAAPTASPGPRDRVRRRTPTRRSWTCTLRDGVKFHDGADLRRQRRRRHRTPSSGTPSNPLHKGRTGAFEYWPGLFGGFLNPPPAS